MPEARITDIMLAVDAEVGFTDAFTNFRTGAVCTDKLEPYECAAWLKV